MAVEIRRRNMSFGSEVSLVQGGKSNLVVKPYKIVSLIQFTESSLELKDITNIFFFLVKRPVSTRPKLSDH